MLDHVFLDSVSALGQALDDVLLERSRHEDRLTTDLLLGDLVWETSVSLPGEDHPPRVRADLTLDWPTWSQSSWRSWTIGEPIDDPPELGIEVVFRLQRLARRPEVAAVMAVLPNESPAIGDGHLDRSNPVLEEALSEDLSSGEVAVEVAYEGSYRFTENTANAD